MCRQIKPILFSILLLTAVSNSLPAQVSNLIGLQQSVSELSLELAKSLPLNASIGLNWPDAYIGKSFPSLPPHFGAGVTFGFSTMSLPTMKTVAEYLGFEIPFDQEKLFLPAYAVEARVGGLFLPFDVGVKFGYLSPVGLWGKDIDVNYILAGADLRYALIDGKSDPSRFNLSIGFGVNYLSGGISGKVPKPQTLNVAGNYITMENPLVNIKWETISVDAKMQISKSLLILTPFLGIGASHAWSSAGYSVDSKVTINGSPISQNYIDAINFLLSHSALENIDVSSTGISSIIQNNAFSFRVFAGTSFNLLVIKLDLLGIYSILDSNFAASFGVRFQI